MLKWSSRILIALFLLGAAGLYFFPSLKQTYIEHRAGDLLIRMQSDAAIQAGFVHTMHEQHWSSRTFLEFFGLQLPLGTTEAVVRAPIKVYYGVRPASLHVRYYEAGVLQLTVDKVEALAVDSDIANLEIKTDIGWARLDAFSGETARQQAKRAFEISKRHAADSLLQSMDVTAHVRAALKDVFMIVPGVHDVGIDRQDKLPLSPPAPD